MNPYFFRGFTASAEKQKQRVKDGRFSLGGSPGDGEVARLSRRGVFTRNGKKTGLLLRHSKPQFHLLIPVVRARHFTQPPVFHQNLIRQEGVIDGNAEPW